MLTVQDKTIICSGQEDHKNLKREDYYGMDSLDPLPWRFSSRRNRLIDTAACSASQHPRPQTASQPNTTPTCFDVVGGRGLGVQRLPGNQNEETILDSLNPLPWSLSNRMNLPTDTTICAASQHPRPQIAIQPTTAPTCFDVVGGRGHGVLRLPGNQKYRALVSMNKVRWSSL